MTSFIDQITTETPSKQNMTNKSETSTPKIRLPDNYYPLSLVKTDNFLRPCGAIMNAQVEAHYKTCEFCANYRDIPNAIALGKENFVLVSYLKTVLNNTYHAELTNTLLNNNIEVNQG